MTETTGTEERGQDTGGKKAHPTRGKRYSPALKKEILVCAQEKGVASAAVKYDVTETTLYEWRKAAKHRGSETGNFPLAPVDEEDSEVQRDRRILAMWRQHPG